ncbi:MAG TPA: hypothetical protein VG367_17240 [Mucilaginibacter sp.]|jgi:hypothetical protein|nr:hypothetical protein [Mucilaginibacter sp.]
MEVHHHPEVEKKGFKEYILEGLMIFIAVFMGFIAENVRESVVEHNREKEYVKEMVNNLKYDTIRCDKNIAVDQVTCRGLDSLRNELQRAITGHVNGNKLYYLSMSSSHVLGRATFNISAYTELRNSGSLRLIADKKLVTDISDYYDRRVMATQSLAPVDLREELRKTDAEFFNWAYFDDYIKGYDHKTNFIVNYDYEKILTMKPAPTLLNTSPVALQRLYNEVAEYEMGVKNYIYFMSWTREAAVSLIGSIRKEYHLKDE